MGRLLLGDGTGAFTDNTPESWSDMAVTLVVALGDLDSDGDLDVVFGKQDTSDQVFFNDGRAGFVLASLVSVATFDGEGQETTYEGNVRVRAAPALAVAADSFGL